MNRFRTATALVVSAALVAVSAGPAAAATPPTKAQQLQAYLNVVRPTAAKARTAQLREVAGSILITARGEPDDFARMRAACKALGLASAGVKRVKRPAVLAEPHASLVAGWRAEALACTRYAAAVEAGDDSADTTLDIYVASARKDQSHWRAEVTVQLRRLGLVVPKWVRDVGTDPLG